MLTKLAPSQRDVHRFELHKYPICRFFYARQDFSLIDEFVVKKLPRCCAKLFFIYLCTANGRDVVSTTHSESRANDDLPNHHYEPGA